MGFKQKRTKGSFQRVCNNELFNMKEYLSISIGVCLLSCVSCVSKTDVTDGTIVVNLDSLAKKDCLSTSSFFDVSNTYYATLDTITEALLGDIDKLKVYDNKIVVLDRNIAKQILVFDANGKFLHPIGRLGHAAGEYVNPQDFTYSKNDDILYVLDTRLKKVLLYQLSTGKYLKSLTNDFPSLHIHYYDGCIYVDNPKVEFGGRKRDFLLVKLSADTGNILGTYINPIEHNGGFDRPLSNVGGPFLMSGFGQFHYSQQFARSVFNVAEEEIRPYLTFKSEDWITADDLQDIDIDRDMRSVHKLMSKNKFNGINHYMETDEFIFCMFVKGMNNMYFMYDKNYSQFSLYSKLADDILFSGSSWSMAKLRYAGYDENGAYFYLSPAEAENALERSCYSNTKFDSIRILGDDFNGAIFFYGYKK